MNRSILPAIAFALLASQPARAQELQQKLAAAKEAAARNQQALRSYSWIEETELLLKGEVRNTKVDSYPWPPEGCWTLSKHANSCVKTSDECSGAGLEY